MDPKHLEANLAALLQDVNKVRPRREGKFVTRVILTSPPSGENLKIDPFVYIPEDRATTDTSQQADDADNEEEKAEATN